MNLKINWLKKVVSHFKPVDFHEDFNLEDFDEELLLDSPMFHKLSVLGRVNPVDINDNVEVNQLLGESVCCLTNGLDNDRIHFENDQDKAAFHQMLFTCYQLITQMRPESEVRH